jgi:putative ABC transport system permease protein
VTTRPPESTGPADTGRSVLRTSDALQVAASGLRGRPLRVVLSALGVAIGVAAMVAVVGISASSRADLDHTLDRLGTNLLTAAPGDTVLGDAAVLPVVAPSMVARIAPVQHVSAIGRIRAGAYRTDKVPVQLTGGIAVLAARPDLLATVAGQMRTGTWFNRSTLAYPSVVLGATTAAQLGVDVPGQRVWLGAMWVSVSGILRPVALAPELDTAALVGWPAAETYLSFDGHPTKIYTRSVRSQVEAVRAVLGATVNPENPYQVKISRPSDALAAQRAADRALASLLLGLGAVALVVGGVGAANTMVISVLERRAEIGLRRALGATRLHIAAQFVLESLLLCLLGGTAGLLIGATITFGYAQNRGWPAVIPAWILLGAVAGSLVVGVVAGLYPAIRAARMDPTRALSAL